MSLTNRRHALMRHGGGGPSQPEGAMPGRAVRGRSQHGPVVVERSMITIESVSGSTANHQVPESAQIALAV